MSYRFYSPSKVDKNSLVKALQFLNAIKTKLSSDSNLYFTENVPHKTFFNFWYDKTFF